MLLNFITPSKDMKMHYKLSASALPQRVAYVWQVRSLNYKIKSSTPVFEALPLTVFIIICCLVVNYSITIINMYLRFT